MNVLFARLNDELRSALDGLNEEQTQLRPSGDASRWNIQQITGHLRLSYEATSEAMNARIAKASATKAKANFAQLCGQFTLLRLGYFPKGRKAPDRVTCAANETALPGILLIQCVDDALSRMDQRVTAAEELFGDRQGAISHMVLGPLNTCQWRKFHLIHGHHHIRQIKAIRDEYKL